MNIFQPTEAERVTYFSFFLTFGKEARQVDKMAMRVLVGCKRVIDYAVKVIIAMKYSSITRVGNTVK